MTTTPNRVLQHPSKGINTTNINPTNRIDAFTDFINQWLENNTKIGGKTHDAEEL